MPLDQAQRINQDAPGNRCTVVYVGSSIDKIAERRAELVDADPAERYADGEAALPALRSRNVDPTGALTLSIEFDRLEGVTEKAAMRRHGFVRSEFDIYPGDPVLVVPPSREHSPDSLPIQATVDEVESTRVSVVPVWQELDDRGAVRRYLDDNRVGFGLLKLLNPLPHERRQNAVERLCDDDTFREVLAGQRPLTFTQSRVADSSRHDPQLNQEQQAAAKYALLSDDLFCIHGPPGTGKTRTLIEIVRRAVDAGEDVLVCADSNQAVDNIVVGESTPAAADDSALHAYGQHGSDEFTLEPAQRPPVRARCRRRVVRRDTRTYCRGGRGNQRKCGDHRPTVRPGRHRRGDAGDDCRVCHPACESRYRSTGGR